MSLWSRLAGVMGNLLTLGGPGAPPTSVVLGQAPGTPAYNPTWFGYVDVYLDPVSGNDANLGNSSGAAVKTMAEVVRRYGSSKPQLVYGQNLTIFQLSAQTANVDAFFFSPQTTGGGSFTWQATMTAVGAAFSPTSVTAKVQTAAGNDLKLNGSLPAGLAQGDMIYNATTGAYASVIAIAGGNATVSQPVIPGSLGIPGVEDNTWSAASTLQAQRTILCNMKTSQPVGGDDNAGLTGGLVTISGIEVVDATGAAEGSGIFFVPVGVTYNVFACRFDPAVIIDGTNALFFPQFQSCWFNGGLLVRSAYVLGGWVTGGTFVDCGDSAILDCDLSILGTTRVNLVGSNVQFGAVHLNAGANLVNDTPYSGGSMTIAVQNAAAILWGAGSINAIHGMRVLNASGNSWASTLLLATIQLEGVSTAGGTVYQAGRWNDGFNVTAANMDTYGGIQNPITGSMYGKTSATQTDTVNPLQCAQKASDQSVTSSTALNNESAMQVTMAKSDVWIVRWTLYIAYASASGIALAVNTPTGATLSVMVLGAAIGGVVTDAEHEATAATGFNVLNIVGSGTAGIIEVTATVVGDGTHAGTIVLAFSQTASSATPTTIKAGSGMVAVRKI